MSTEAPGRAADDMRVAFEASYLQRLGEAAQFVKVYRLLRQSDDTYRQYLVQAEWVGWQAAWQASRAAALDAAIDECRVIKWEHEAAGERNDNEWEDGLIAHGAELCAHALRALKEPAK